jgi:acylphosphatase
MVRYIDEDNMVCKCVHYRGRVQGVGFRYMTERLARGFPVAGFVRNLNDGSVELVAEGAPDQVEAFLAAVAQHMAGYIQDIDIADQNVENYRGFVIRH